MSWPFKRTAKPSDTSQLCETVAKLAQELRAASESSRLLSEKLLEAVQEKDNQIRLVLESKFQTHIAMYPGKRSDPPKPEDAEYLSDVTEASQESTEAAIKAVEKNYKKATTALDEALAQDLESEFREIAAEHVESHQKGVTE